METELSTSSANYLVAYNFGRIDALEGEPDTRFSGVPNGTAEENAVWPQIRDAYLEGYQKQSARIIAPAVLESKYSSFEIHATSIYGTNLHWNGEKFTDQGDAWSFESLADAKAEYLDRENMENITVYGWPASTDENPEVAMVAITTL